MTDKKLTALFFGRASENLACQYLRLKGYKIIAQNHRSPLGEIDIIAMRKQTLCFVEVKSRKTMDEALHALSLRQQKRIISSARAFLSTNRRYVDHTIRFDLIAIAPLSWPQHLKNAWFDES